MEPKILIDPSKITACAAKVVIVISKVKLLNATMNITKITLCVKVTVMMNFDAYRRCKTQPRCHHEGTTNLSFDLVLNSTIY